MSRASEENATWSSWLFSQAEAGAGTANTEGQTQTEKTAKPAAAESTSTNTAAATDGSKSERPTRVRRPLKDREFGKASDRKTTSATGSATGTTAQSSSP